MQEFDGCHDEVDEEFEEVEEIVSARECLTRFMVWMQEERHIGPKWDNKAMQEAITLFMDSTIEEMTGE